MHARTGAAFIGLLASLSPVPRDFYRYPSKMLTSPALSEIMIDPWNPSPHEIRSWAYDPDAVDPCQDWDLALSWLQDESVYLSLAADDRCPKRRFFLSLLYLMVGDAVRTGFRVKPKPIVMGFIQHGNSYPHPDIIAWQQRSRELIANPKAFEYDAWCGGQLAYAVSNRDGG